jgi:hypothetical protein
MLGLIRGNNESRTKTNRRSIPNEHVVDTMRVSTPKHVIVLWSTITAMGFDCRSKWYFSKKQKQ